MIDIEWVDELPPKQHVKGKYHDFAQALKTRPGTWAKLPYTGTNGTQIAKTIRDAAGGAHGVGYADFRATPESRGYYEAAARQGVCYVRFVQVDADGSPIPSPENESQEN